MTDPAFHTRPDGVRIAYRHRAGRGPTLVFFPGYLSDMEGGKAVALDGWAEQENRAMLRFDYSGCGISEGAFADGTLSRWRDDALELIDAVTRGPIVLVGSSMGGWLMLLVALARPERVAGMVGIASAPDFTSWGFTDAQKAALVRDGFITEPSEYSDDGYITTRGFWESGEANLLMGGAIGIDCPVRLLHGQRDDVVPFDFSLRLADGLRSADVQTILVKDGDHRLSREGDIALLLATVGQLLDSL